MDDSWTTNANDMSEMDVPSLLEMMKTIEADRRQECNRGVDIFLLTRPVFDRLLLQFGVVDSSVFSTVFYSRCGIVFSGIPFEIHPPAIIKQRAVELMAQGKYVVIINEE